MDFEILKDQIEPPDQNNNVWIFHVRLADKQRSEAKIRIDASDLNAWVKQALGRDPHSDRGDKDKLGDLRANWEKIEAVLRKHLSAALAP